MLSNRIAALAEVLLVLALGNLIGAALYPFLVSDAILDGSASDISLAFASGLLIFLRLGTAGALGLALLYFRTGTTPRRAGLSRNNQPITSLLKQGLVIGLISSWLIGLLFAVHSLIPLGEGLAAWWTYDETPLNTAFVISLLATSMLIPPLTEEILFRGYNRVRIVESFGPMAGVILTGIVFAVSHTRYLQADGMLLLFMLEIILSSFLWTYVAHKSGSIIPPFIAHALSNGIASAILFDVWIPFVLVSIAVLIMRKDIKSLLVEIKQDWQQDQQRNNLWQGLGIVFLVLISALAMLSLWGRIPAIIALGGGCLLYTIGFIIWEKRRSQT